MSTGSNTLYAGNYIYEGLSGSETLKFFNHPEGYVDVISGVYKYVYQYKDHLGNVRLSYKDNSGTLEILEENNYYPFGLKHKGYNGSVSSSNIALKKTYNGKEFQDELGLNWHDYGARNYDATLGRWMNIDPMAFKYYKQSPYNYALNNPTIFVDPDGMQVEWAEELNRKDRRTLRRAIRFLKRNSKTFKKEYKELKSSKLVFTVGKVSGAFGLFKRPNPKLEGGDVDDDGIMSPITITHDISDGASGGDISVDLDLFRELEADGLDITAKGAAINVLPEEFSGAALFLKYITDTNGVDDGSRAAGNIEFETKMLSGIILNEAGESLSQSSSQRKAEEFGIKYKKEKKQKDNILMH